MTDFPHFLLRAGRTTQPFTSVPPRGGKHSSPPRPERISHADKLLADLARAERQAQQRLDTEPIRRGLHQFIPMRFSEHSDFPLELKRLENERKGIRIISVRAVKGHREYLVAVPDSQVGRLARVFRDYRDKDTKQGKPKNEPLAASISAINDAELADYWTDVDETLPPLTEILWWEVWLNDRQSAPGFNTEEWFRRVADRQGIPLSDQRVRFPERLVILAYTSLTQWLQFPGLLRRLAELRRAHIVAGEFTQLAPAAQAEFVKDLLDRTQFAPPSAVRICILDSGVNRGHLLLENALAPQDAHSWREEWGTNDHEGHGTQMAGVCLFGPLTEPLAHRGPVVLNHRLESVKVLPPEGRNEPPDYGPITTGSMAQAELSAPQVSRVFCLPVTAPGDDHWRPTLWSATLDQASSGASDEVRRLLVVSAGNLREEVGKNYPNDNHLASVEDPSQAWNVLTVGAYTNLAWMSDPDLEGYTPIATPGCLSPASRTSLCWGGAPWPYKPDVVFEGGNYVKDQTGFVTNDDDLSILTTQSPSEFSAALLGTTRDTSAATAQAARMAAILQAEYPDYWPETIRGLIVHSAEWTPQMLQEFRHQNRRERLRVYGMGVPNLERARRSARGFATMVIQDQLQPFRVDGSDNATNEMHFHKLPLPREVLEELGSVSVRMRVTLSYFIEPNPPRRGYVAQHQYASHGLRFSVRRPEESPERMLARLSRDFWQQGEDGKRVRPKGNAKDERNWDLGPERVSVRGSIHSDAWNGTAAQLASSDLVAVYPVTGWWRYRTSPEIVEKSARYSLIVSISTDETSLDLYTAIARVIATPVPMPATPVEIPS